MYLDEIKGVLRILQFVVTPLIEEKSAPVAPNLLVNGNGYRRSVDVFNRGLTPGSGTPVSTGSGQEGSRRYFGRRTPTLDGSREGCVWRHRSRSVSGKDNECWWYTVSRIGGCYYYTKEGVGCRRETVSLDPVGKGEEGDSGGNRLLFPPRLLLTLPPEYRGLTRTFTERSGYVDTSR